MGKQFSGFPMKGTTSLAKTGTEQVVIEWNITHAMGDDGNWMELREPIAAYTYWSLSEAATPYTEDKLDRLGFNWDFKNPTFNENPQILEQTLSTYQGKQQTKWDLAGGGPKEAPEDRIRDLNRRFAGKRTPPPKAPTGKPKTPPASPKPAHEAPPSAEDAIQNDPEYDPAALNNRF